MSHEQTPKAAPPEQLFRDRRVDSFAGKLPQETVGLAQEAVSHARQGLKVLVGGIEEAGLGDPHRPERDIVKRVQESGNEVLENVTHFEVTPVLGKLLRDDHEEKTGVGSKERDEERLAEQAARAKAFEGLSKAVVAALDADPGHVSKSVPSVGYKQRGPGGGGDKEHSLGYGATLDAVQMMRDIVSGGPKSTLSGIREAETHWTTHTGEVVAYDKYYFKDDSTLIITEVPLAGLGVSIIVRETIPWYPTDKKTARVETYVVSTVAADKRRYHVSEAMEGRTSDYKKQIFDPKEARDARTRLDNDRREAVRRREDEQRRQKILADTALKYK